MLTTIAAPTTHVVTLTVTEKGYRRRADGRPDLTDPDLAADLDALTSELRGGRTDAPARSPLGLLLRGLALRARRDAGNLTVVCCDNLADNGSGPGGPRHRHARRRPARRPPARVDR